MNLCGLPTTKHALVSLKNAHKTCNLPDRFAHSADSAQFQPSQTKIVGQIASPTGIFEQN